jgi:hypothetical protein
MGLLQKMGWLANGISTIPTNINVENDNGVYPALDLDQRLAHVVMVDRSFGSGGHSRTHALRFAAWLVHCADTSAGHGDFIAVLDAVERSDARA